MYLYTFLSNNTQHHCITLDYADAIPGKNTVYLEAKLIKATDSNPYFNSAKFVSRIDFIYYIKENRLSLSIKDSVDESDLSAIKSILDYDSNKNAIIYHMRQCGCINKLDKPALKDIVYNYLKNLDFFGLDCAIYKCISNYIVDKYEYKVNSRCRYDVSAFETVMEYLAKDKDLSQEEKAQAISSAYCLYAEVYSV